MVKYADYVLLCWFVFPLGFAVPSLFQARGSSSAPQEEQGGPQPPECLLGFFLVWGFFFRGKTGHRWEAPGNL